VDRADFWSTVFPFGLPISASISARGPPPALDVCRSLVGWRWRAVDVRVVGERCLCAGDAGHSRVECEIMAWSIDVGVRLCEQLAQPLYFAVVHGLVGGGGGVAGGLFGIAEAGNDAGDVDVGEEVALGDAGEAFEVLG
jgi:hypothetical protein